MGLTNFVLTSIGAVAVALVAAECKAWAPWVSERLRRAALTFLPAMLKERLDEEWAAHLSETPGYVSKIICAGGFVLASAHIRIAVSTRYFIFKAGKSLPGLCLRISIRFVKSASMIGRLPLPTIIIALTRRGLMQCCIRIFYFSFVVAKWRAGLIDVPERRATAMAAVEYSATGSFNLLVQTIKLGKFTPEIAAEVKKYLLPDIDQISDN